MKKLILLLTILHFFGACNGQNESKSMIKSEELIFKMSPTSENASYHSLSEYDKAGKKTKEFLIFPDKESGKEKRELVYEYQYIQNKLSNIIAYGNNKIEYQVEFIYKNDKKAKDKYTFFNDGKPDPTNIRNNYSEYEYLDKTIVERNYQMNDKKKDFELKNINYELFDDNKNTIESKTLNSLGELNIQFNYQYDKKNRRISEVSSTGTSREYSYDQNDNIIKETLKTKGYTTIFEYTYKYDKFGNWIEKSQKEFSQKEPVQKLLSEEIIIRKLEYY